MDLSPFVKTKADAQDFTTRIAAVLEHVYHTNFNLEKEILEQLGIKKKEKFLQLLRDNNVVITSAAPLQDFLKKVLEDVKKLPVLSLTIAIEPTEQTLQILSEWFMMHVKRQILLDVTVDPKLLAGATITFSGKYLDVSLKPAYEKMLHEMMTPKSNSPSPLSDHTQSAPKAVPAQHGLPTATSVPK